MNIQKLRQLGLGLFPPEILAAPAAPEEEVPTAIQQQDAPASDGSGFKPGSSSRRSYGLELFEEELRKESLRKRSQAQGLHVNTPFRSIEIKPDLDRGLIEDTDSLRVLDGLDLEFRDDDHIKVVQKRRMFGSTDRNMNGTCLLIIIPKRKMIRMPRPPDSHVSPESVPSFFIRVLLVELSDSASVNSAIDWLLPNGDEYPQETLGLACKLDSERSLSLIQLSLHQRCVLVRILPGHSSSWSFASSPDRLVRLLATTGVTKTGVDIEDHVLAIYWATGMVVNGFKNISEVYISKERSLSLMAIFRKLYDWEWSQKSEITKSDWGAKDFSPKQIKYGILEAWSSRMIALEGKAAVDGKVSLMSLENLPREILDLFGRALADAFQTEESVNRETSGTLTETLLPDTIELIQHDFKSRLKGKCFVEMQLEEGSAQYQIKSRRGKSVLLAPRQKPERREKRTSGKSGPSRKEEAGPPIALESIKSVTILEPTPQLGNWRSKRLWEGLRNMIRNPSACPKFLFLALGCSAPLNLRDDDSSRFQSFWGTTQAMDFKSEPFSTISGHLNESQRQAWETILTTPLSATIGPPGSGKTSLVTAVAKSWLAGRGEDNSKEVLLCTAYQNVAVRHLAETLVEGEVPGVLLLISEDYYRGWHEGYYIQLLDSLVVSASDQSESLLNMSAWRTRNAECSSPNIVVCTVDMIGCPSFVTCLMSGKVTGLIIDESSQASDVSFLRPMVCLPDLAMVSVLGDPNQLPPFTAIRNDQTLPSVFDLVSNGSKVNFLREQYRMPEEICEFLSSEIYDNVLMTAKHRIDESKDEKDHNPLLWAHVKGISASAPGKTSLHNLAEASAIVRFCQTLVVNMNVASERVVVLCLYEEQTRRISDSLSAIGLEIPVHNVDSFQGQQCDIVLISLVVGRSFSPFAADHRRACVMMSRVRRLLCVFGDYDEVRKNHQAGLWMKLANHCNKRNLVVDEDKVDAFLSASVEMAKEAWQKRQEKSSKISETLELLSNVVDPDAVPAVRIPVQVIFKART